MKTANFTELRTNLSEYMNSVIDDTETIIVNRGKGKGVVIISLEEYNAITETQYILNSSEMMKVINAGEKELAEGKGKTLKVADLWK